jgi:hypothetical protein
MTTSIIRNTYILLIFFLFFCPGITFAEGASISDLVVSNTRDELIIFLKINGTFNEKMEKAILSGVPVTFSFFVKLYRTRNMWIDKHIADIEVLHTIKYSTIKREYIIYRSWDTNNPSVTQSFLEAQKLMTEINSLKVVPLNTLEKGRQYQIRAKAKLIKQALPYYLHHVLFFLYLWNFETDWQAIDFVF